MDSNIKAATLQKKKSTISKGKVKKTLRNTLCRPDPVFWPSISEDESEILAALSVYKIEIPEFIKPSWKVLKAIPKDQRPKQPKIQKVEGLIFGIRECTEALKSKTCSAVIVESSINPRTIIQPLIEACIANEVPVLCMKGLRKSSATNYGIPTSCLAIKNGFLQDLRSKIEEIQKSHRPPQPIKKIDSAGKDKVSDNTPVKVEIVPDILEVGETSKHEISQTPINFTYLYRTNKKTRVFNPSSEQTKIKKAFIGQDFIKFSEKLEQKTDTKTYKSMILKRITNNPNRLKKK